MGNTINKEKSTPDITATKNIHGSIPHRRRNPLTGEWVLVSAQRTQRPWLGQEERPVVDKPLPYDPQCYLCPGNRRVSGAHNPEYTSTYVFTNDYPALLPNGRDSLAPIKNDLLSWQSTRGTSEVICYSPRHDLTLPELPLDQINAVIRLWRDRTIELGKSYSWVQIFENKGAMMGASNSHPHGQIWAGDFIPTVVEKEDRRQAEYHSRQGRWLLQDYLEVENRAGSRLVQSNDHWTALVPWWAVWPYELILLPNKPLSSFHEISTGQINGLAHILQSVLTKYDRLFDISFPYSMGWHGAPRFPAATDYWTLHCHIYPPLLRSAGVRKFMVGYELLAEPQRDLTPEEAAARLRSLETNYD